MSVFILPLLLLVILLDALWFHDVGTSARSCTQGQQRNLCSDSQESTLVIERKVPVLLHKERRYL